MQRNQYLLLLVGIIIFSVIYFLGDFKGEKKPVTTEKPAMNGGNMPSSPVADIVPIVIDDVIKHSTDLLSAEKKSKYEQLNAAASTPSAIAYKDLAEFWEAEKELNIAANFYKKAAFLENTEKSITFAGNLLLALMQKTSEPSVKKWQALEAVDCFKKALEINSENTDTKIALATCYTEGTGETMQGVTLLREITQKDSNNVPANLILGKLAIQSGQLEKAIRRLELVLTLQPGNTEAMYFLAEAYKSSGDKQKAIELFEKCKKLINQPEFTKEIDQYINSFK